MKHRSALCLIALGLAPALFAQKPKQTPPPPAEPKGFSVPAPRTFALDNGLAVTLVPYGTVPKVTVRLAVRGASVQRAASSGYDSSRSSALKRRIIVGGLVLASLILITVSFRSSALDGAKGTAASILRPFEVAANRVTRPFRDAASWTRGIRCRKTRSEILRVDSISGTSTGSIWKSTRT